MTTANINTMENKYRPALKRAQFFRMLGLAMIIMQLFSCGDQEKRLPMIPDGVKTTIIDGKEVIDTIYKSIPEFSYYNQDSVLINNNLFDGKIYVADFFFTSCPTICPVMHRNMMKVFEKYKDHPDVMLLSHTIDYKYDKPSKLKAYKTKLGADGKQWQFVWGTKEAIYSTAQHNYLVAVGEDKAAAGGYIHQGYLVLIDKHRRIRNAYDGTNEEQVRKLMIDMDILLKEK
jgi:protein SCO1/2